MHNHLVNIIIGLPVEQSFDSVLAGEALEQMELMLECALLKIAGDADVKRA